MNMCATYLIYRVVQWQLATLVISITLITVFVWSSNMGFVGWSIVRRIRQKLGLFLCQIQQRQLTTWSMNWVPVGKDFNIFFLMLIKVSHILHKCRYYIEQNLNRHCLCFRAASGDKNCLTDYLILHGGHCKVNFK